MVIIKILHLKAEGLSNSYFKLPAISVKITPSACAPASGYPKLLSPTVPARPMRATISFVYSAPLTAASAPFSKAVFMSSSFEALANQESTHGARASTSVLSPTTAPPPNDLHRSIVCLAVLLATFQRILSLLAHASRRLLY